LGFEEFSGLGEVSGNKFDCTLPDTRSMATAEIPKVVITAQIGSKPVLVHPESESPALMRFIF
jgi:hypothetical protein